MAIPLSSQCTNYGTGGRKGDTPRHFKLRVYNALYSKNIDIWSDNFFVNRTTRLIDRVSIKWFISKKEVHSVCLCGFTDMSHMLHILRWHELKMEILGMNVHATTKSDFTDEVVWYLMSLRENPSVTSCFPHKGSVMQKAFLCLTLL